MSHHQLDNRIEVDIREEPNNNSAASVEPSSPSLYVNSRSSYETSESDVTYSASNSIPSQNMEDFPVNSLDSTTSPTSITSQPKHSFTLHYSSNNMLPIIEKVDETIALDLYNFWDIEKRGYLYPSDIVLQNLDIKFIQAIIRVLAPHSDIILKENIIECIHILKNGDLSLKVKLLIQFMNTNGNQMISFDELQEYLQVTDNSMLTKLGLKNKRDESFEDDTSSISNSSFTYEDILSIFQASDRGLEAITIFCEQILRILTASVPKRHASTILGISSHSISFTGLTSKDSNLCTASWNNVKEWYNKAKQQVQTVSNTCNIFKTILILLQIALWLFYFFYHYFKGYPLAFCFAKGFGLNLRILSMLIYLTMARTTMGQLYSIKFLRSFIPLGVNIEVHSFLGFCIGIHMFGHTFGHIAYQTMYTTGFQNAFTQLSLLNGATWNNKLKGDGITGFILIFLVLLMGSTALLRSLSSKYYQLFTLSHFAYVLYLPMIFLHVPRLWPYFVTVALIMILERLYDLIQNTLYTTLGQSRPCNNGITYLSIPRYGIMTYPGSYYRIKIPALSVYEWHPFSLAGSTSSHHLSFFIASTGDWTKGLHELVKDPTRRAQTIVQVQGPFLAPASQVLIRKPNTRILCVASGIGITPFFSVMATKVSDELNFENDRLLYKQLFQETSNRLEQLSLHKHDRSQNSLIKVLLNSQSMDSYHHKRPSNLLVKSTSSLIIDDENQVLKDLEAGYNTNGSQSKRPSHSSKESYSNDDSDTDSDSEKQTNKDNNSILRIVWANRDVKELHFYLDYVHHLVKSQEELFDDDDNNEDFYNDAHNASRPRKERMSKRLRRKRIVVEVEVYLTGLGNKTDPIYMLSQTLFLLSIANQSSSYMKIHFGRPDLDKIVKAFSPEEVYYCGGNALKEKLHDICCQQKIPFHPESFDSGGGAVINAYKSLAHGLSDWFCRKK